MLSMTYCNDPRAHWWQAAARRVKDTAFFGVQSPLDLIPHWRPEFPAWPRESRACPGLRLIVDTMASGARAGGGAGTRNKEVRNARSCMLEAVIPRNRDDIARTR